MKNSIEQLLDTRERLIIDLKKEVLGPGSEISIPDEEHEIISSSPEQRYSMGILFPKGQHYNVENDDNEGTGNDNQEERQYELIQEDNDESKDQGLSDPAAGSNPGDEEELDENISLATQNMPASMGISFVTNGKTDRIKCRISFATYRRTTVEDCRIPASKDIPEQVIVPELVDEWVLFDQKEKTFKLSKKGLTPKIIRGITEKMDTDTLGFRNILYKLQTQLSRGYVREPHSVEEMIIFDKADYVDNNRKICGTELKITALRRALDNDRYAVTVMLVNDETGKTNGTKCIYQPEIIISTDDNEFTLCDYSGLRDITALDKEEQSLELLYRNKRVFGSGLGVSVDWKVDENGKGYIKSTYFPVKEVPKMDFKMPEEYHVNQKVFSMKYLSDLHDEKKEEKIKLLCSFVEAYKKWIDRTEEKIKELANKYQIPAKENMEGCKKAYNRMFAGITDLRENELAWNSFELANRAMFMQRVHIKLQQEGEHFPDDDEYGDFLENLDYYAADQKITDRYEWRPFQLAFLLLSVRSITDDTSPDRDAVDLIWFPTGGGKTEAYLGLTAFTIFYRRLKFPDRCDGTSVMMRYTLRLLTAQQFTRAATLICACEFIRRDSMQRNPQYKKYPLGNSEITIGLWIGDEHTPNTNSKADENLKALQKATFSNIDEVKNKNNKFQVLKCPWCGTKMVRERKAGRLTGQFGYRMNKGKHFELYCPQAGCGFEQKLPIQIVDEELYLSPPTLLFGTVDKFAMFPFREEIGSFFGIGTDNRPPELIIQDELHLISGPLGTMVGMYETIIDYLNKQKGIGSKIIASTATIRKAAEQCSALYDREISQFPHPGINAEDSFFAREATLDYSKNEYGRKYVGLIPSGKTKAMMEVRILAAILQHVEIMDIPEDIKDKFWTLTAYFNSLKELGKCATLVDDDVKDAIRRTARRIHNTVKIRRTYRADELTSRVNTSRLNKTLDKLEKTVYSKENIEKGNYASDIVLATNMISVGIDVARLNTMLIVGQPKLTSEYIQASSRIGREYPGVAFVLYDGSKSRDRSHYEQFVSYHDSFYKVVEPTGVTPFSKPARERALHAVCIAMIRQLISELRSESGAAEFSMKEYSEDIQNIKGFIVKRVQDIIQKINSGMADDSEEIAEEIDMIFERWEQLVDLYPKDHFFYGQKYLVRHPEEPDGRLLKPYGSDDRDPARDTMTSMRNVDTAVSGNILFWEEDANE